MTVRSAGWVLRVALTLPLLAGCIYFNALYDAGNAYDAGVEALQEERIQAARQQFDSVIAKTDRIVSDHPNSKYADDAAFLKTRAEIHNELWDAAFVSAQYARQLSRRSRDTALASGLQGVAAVQLGRGGLADSLLSFALEGELDADDRATFLFHRGLARLRLDRPEEAALDLEGAAAQIDLTREARLDLARALFQIGDFERSADVTADLLDMDELGQLSEAGKAHVDSLTLHAADVLDPRLEELLRQPDLRETKRSLLQFLRGLTLAELGAYDAAIAVLDSAAGARATSRWAPQAGLRASEIRLQRAESPSDIETVVPGLERATRSATAPTRARAVALSSAAIQFVGFTSACETRGASAAEAALRAAEIAGTVLASPVVARGLYLKYLELAPDSPWSAKAMYGALSFSGHRAGDWVRDEGDATDARLRAELESLPEDDPYRIAIEGTGRDRWSDSAFVLAEVDLEQRISEIQMLFDTTVVRARRDSVSPQPAEVDSVVSGQEEDEVAF